MEKCILNAVITLFILVPIVIGFFLLGIALPLGGIIPDSAKDSHAASEV